jgi:hypothetical protein
MHVAERPLSGRSLRLPDNGLFDHSRRPRVPHDRGGPITRAGRNPSARSPATPTAGPPSSAVRRRAGRNRSGQRRSMSQEPLPLRARSSAPTRNFTFTSSEYVSHASARRSEVGRPESPAPGNNAAAMAQPPSAYLRSTKDEHYSFTEAATMRMVTPHRDQVARAISARFFEAVASSVIDVSLQRDHVNSHKEPQPCRGSWRGGSQWHDGYRLIVSSIPRPSLTVRRADAILDDKWSVALDHWTMGVRPGEAVSGV